MTVPVAPPPSPADIRARYGFVGEMAKSVPEIDRILQQAIREQWTTDRFLMSVANTHWWKTNNQAVREWTTLVATDPATAHARQAHGEGDIRARAWALGINLNAQQSREAFFFRQFSTGMSDENFDGYLARTFFDAYKFDWVNGQGKAAETAQALDSLRHAYGMPDGEEYRWVRDRLNDIMQGEQTLEGAELAARAYARTKYAGYADRIEAGETVIDIARPYMDSYSQILETSASSIHDQQIQRALQARGADGKPVQMATWQFEQQLRKDARWSKTNNAKENMADFITKVGEDFGYVSTGGS